MPIIETKGSMSSQGYGQFARSGAAPAYIEDVFSTWLYTGNNSTQTIPNGIRLAAGATSAGWIGALGGSSSDTGYSVAIDGSGNVYVCGDATISGTNYFIIAKYNTSGAIQWQRRLGGSSINGGYSVAIDGSGNVYVCGYASISGANDFIIAKYNTSGAIQWQRSLGGSGSDLGNSVAVDSSGNVYVCGYSNASGTYDFIIAKYNTSGAIQWQRSLGGSSDDGGYSVAVDSSGNVYVCGYSNASGTYDFIIAKYNTSGTIQWQRRLGGSGSNFGHSVAVDSSGNVYVCGYSNASGTYDFIIAKYNTSGAIQWQRSLGGSGSDLGYSVAVDSSGNVYVCGFSDASGANDFIIAKYNTSGAIQWQRSLGGSSDDGGRSVAVDSSGNVYVCGYANASGSYDFIIAKLPGDGSGTGAYSVGGATLTYAASTLTDAASTLTDAASTLTDAASTLTDAASTLTDAATTLNSNVTPLAEGAGLGGLVWIKGRSTTSDHALYDTTRGATFDLVSNSSAAQTTQAQGLTAFLGSGFSIGSLAKLNTSAAIYAAWTFAEQPKFFDVVTYTGNGVAGRQIPHNLGVVPGMVIIKSTSFVGADWLVRHRSITGSQEGLTLNTTAGTMTSNAFFDTYANANTASFFAVGSAGAVNGVGNTYVAYLFAHDAGGFGASGTDNVISCGSFTTDGSGNATVNLGYEPQWLLTKQTNASNSWYLEDTMRGMSLTRYSILVPNTAAAEANAAVPFSSPTATGFTAANQNPSSTFIYIAIRRGPMRTPTLGTSVFTPTVYTGTATDNRLVNTTIAPDMVWMRQRNDTTVAGMVVGDRMRGQPYLFTGSTNSENSSLDAFSRQLVGGTEYGTAFSAMNGVYVGKDATVNLNVSTTSNNQIAEAFRRAPGFFDVVCYTGGASSLVVNHNLGVAPELIISKNRSGTNEPNWYVGSASLPNGFTGTGHVLQLQSTAASSQQGYFTSVNSTSATYANVVARSGQTYVTYLFASCPGVSKVGSYTGTGSTVQVDCGFTSGARFVLIKRINGTGSWYVWDSARGIIAANDPYLVLNSTAAEVTNTDWVDTLATGFEVSNAGSNLVNVNGGTYLFLAIA